MMGDLQDWLKAAQWLFILFWSFFVDSKRYLKCICAFGLSKAFRPTIFDTEPETWLLFNAKVSPFRFGVSYYILISVFARPNNHPELRPCHVGDALARKFMKGPKLLHLGYGSTLGCQREHQHDHMWYWRIQPFLGSPHTHIGTLRPSSACVPASHSVTRAIHLQ